MTEINRMFPKKNVHQRQRAVTKNGPFIDLNSFIMKIVSGPNY